MKLCACGNAVDDSGALCPRCAALQTLELRHGATAGEIRAAYHLLVKVWHPDRFGNDTKLREAAEEKLKAINSAHLLLTSTEKHSRARRPRRAQSAETRKASAENVQTASMRPAAAPAARFRILRGFRNLLVTFAALGAVQRLLVVACGLGTTALFVRFVDSQLASDPETARVYMEFRQAIARESGSSTTRMLDEVQERFHDLNPFHSTMAAEPVAFAVPPANPADSPAPAPVSHGVKKPVQPAIRLMPYVTVGLTQDEVMAIAGTPVSSSEDRLVYKGAEIDFSGGKVAGWKIDPFTSPIRVKLWPDAPVDTSLQFFSAGSTKNDVLVVQGSPTSFTQDRFGYGTSEVYFQNDRVVSWKNDPMSVPLRVASR